MLSNRILEELRTANIKMKFGQNKIITNIHIDHKFITWKVNSCSLNGIYDFSVSEIFIKLTSS
jgi:hypothetical protein